MEYEKIFSTVGIVLIAVLAYSALLANWNSTYNQNVGSSFQNTYNDVATLSNSSLFTLSTTTANNTNTASGAGTTSVNTDLVSRALSVITVLPTLLGLIPALFNDAAVIFGIPAQYVSVATWIFLFSFAILFAYLLIIGVRRLL